MRAICLVGSPAPTSRTGIAVRALAHLLLQRGFDVDVVNLAECDLPHTDPDSYWSTQPHPNPTARQFIDAVLRADAVVLGTPVQHAGYSGLLKSALDLLPADAFEYKAVGLVANAGGVRGASIACEHLRTVVKALGGWTIPTQVSTTAADFDGATDQAPAALLAAAPLRRCEEMAEQILSFTKAIRPISPVRPI
jgi:FMN reductase